MSRGIMRYAGAVLIVLVAMWVAFVVAMRTEFRPVQNALRRMNRAVLNPRTMETAGQPGADASVIRHVGRTTGTPYETPVQALTTDDGFVIALPYGTSADWLRNVMAAGTAVVVTDGKAYRVDHPEVVRGAAAEPHVPSNYRRRHRLYGVDRFLLLRREEAPEAGEQTAEPS